MPRFLPRVLTAPCAGLLLLLLGACTPLANLPDTDGGVGGPVSADDAGVDSDAGPPLCDDTLPTGPACCDSSGLRLSSAECGDDGWTCEDNGALCECQGEAATFFCTDTCGSDAFVDATCGEDGWTCEGLVRSDTCEAGTCWGFPGDCCINPSCVDGSWQCESIQDPC